MALPWLLFLVGLLNFLPISSGEKQVANVKEPVTLSCNYGIPNKEMSNYRVYWQNGDKVVQAYVHGKSVEDLIDASYVNRTTAIDMSNNLSITILSLRVSDEGTYECIVQKLVGGQYRRVQKLDVKLSIRADFSDPIINEHREELPFPSWRITCSSKEGYPQPMLLWLNNGKELTSFNTTTLQDPTTRLYNIESELRVNQTKNLSLTCLIKYGDFGVSRNITLKINPDPVPTLQPPIIVSIALISICFFLAVLLLLLKRCPCQNCKQPKDGLCCVPQEVTVAATEEEANDSMLPLAQVETAATSDKAASV